MREAILRACEPKPRVASREYLFASLKRWYLLQGEAILRACEPEPLFVSFKRWYLLHVGVLHYAK